MTFFSFVLSFSEVSPQTAAFSAFPKSLDDPSPATDSVDLLWPRPCLSPGPASSPALVLALALAPAPAPPWLRIGPGPASDLALALALTLTLASLFPGSVSDLAPPLPWPCPSPPLAQ